MADLIDIYNRALAKIGEPSITSPTQAVTRAEKVDQMYAGVRDAVLRDHLWNFAMKRARLPASADAPAWGFGFSYPLPSDWLRLWSVEGLDQRDYTVEGGAILANAGGGLNIAYIARIEETSLFPADFVEYLALRLAIELIPSLRPSEAKNTRLRRDLERMAARVKLVDAQEGQTPELEIYEWEAARL